MMNEIGDSISMLPVIAESLKKLAMDTNLFVSESTSLVEKNWRR
jgi:hypothetical protein